MNELFFCYSATSKWWGVFCTDCLSILMDNPFQALDSESKDHIWVHRAGSYEHEQACELCTHVASGGSSIAHHERLTNALYN